MSSVARYLKKNWGAPLVIAFIWLLLVSAAQLSLGYTALANEIALYAYFCLIVGVVLQIASFLKYSNEEESHEAAFRARIERRSYALAGLIAILVVGGTAAAVYLPETAGGQSVSTASTATQTFSASASPVNLLHEPDGSTIITFSVSITGGSAPYKVSALWSDGLNQTSTTDSFSRTIPVNQTIPTSATVKVVDSKKQVVTLTVQIPSNTVTTTTQSITTTSVTTSSQTSVTTSSTGSSSSTSTTTTTSTSSSDTFPALNLLVFPVKEIAEPNGSVLDHFSASVIGGETPYTFIARWSDGFTQTSSDGTFSRLFTSNSVIPSFVTVVVTSADGQAVQVIITT